MAEQNQEQESAEKRISNELANQASHPPGSAEAERAKERRTQAEEDLARTRAQKQENSK